MIAEIFMVMIMENDFRNGSFNTPICLPKLGENLGELNNPIHIKQSHFNNYN